MGESSATPLKLQFDRRVRLDFRGATITSDAGLLACRELDAALGLTETANDYIHESRTGRNVQHPLLPLLRQSVYSRLCAGLQPGQLHEKADFARVSETLVTAKRADQAHQDGWRSGAACQEVGVSAC